MEEPCGICGDVGVIDAISVCSQCKTAREHVYCRKSFNDDIPNQWLCETCEMEGKISPKSLKDDSSKTKPSGTVDKENKGSADCSKLPKWEKIVKTGKVKYIAAEEAILLSSGAKKFHSPSKINVHSSSGPAVTLGLVSSRTPIKPRATPPKSPVVVKANPSFRPSELLPSRHGKMQINSVVQQEGPKGGNDCANVESRNFDAENHDLTDILPEAEKCFQVPALHSYWKGSFEIVTSNNKELNDGFRAHPPSKVRRKIYEFSKKLPEVLQFKMLPRDSIWTEIFQDDCPNEDDIGMYFFSNNSQRSANYIFLLEFMETQELVMRCYMDGVELFVFTSKLLSSKSQRWNGEYFLWGVFRRVKKHKDVCKLNEEHPSSDCAQDTGNANGDDGVVDMDIDMLAGKDVGRVDIANSRESSRRSCGTSGEENATIISVPGSNTEIHSVSREVDSAIQQPSREVKKELCNDIPPGFEGIYKLKVQNYAHKEATVPVEKQLRLDGRVISPAKGSACRSQPKPIEDSDSPRLQGKHRQKQYEDDECFQQAPARTLATDSMAAYTCPLSVKRNAFDVAEKVVGHDNERCVKTEKNEFMPTPISKEDCSKSPLCSQFKDKVPPRRQ
ncbi:unnamed protein product [Camellia sinensis]